MQVVFERSPRVVYEHPLAAIHESEVQTLLSLQFEEFEVVIHLKDGGFGLAHVVLHTDDAQRLFALQFGVTVTLQLA
jgi:hypothetical protein